jgi:hypothetical protein
MYILSLACDNFLMEVFMVNAKEAHGSFYFACDNTVETTIMSV